jgi:hypothetical protein
MEKTRHPNLLALEGFYPTDITEFHERVLAAHQSDTSMWLMESLDFRNWLQTNGSFLWLIGPPGAGNTTLFSAAVQSILSTEHMAPTKPRTTFAFYYCSFDEPKTQKTCNVIGSLLSQIMLRDKGSFRPLLKTYEARTHQGSNKRPPTIRESKSIMRSVASDADVVFMIDALDECSDRADLLLYLQFLLEELPNVTVLATSRSEPDVKKALSEWYRVRLEDRADDMNDDVRSYIYTRMRETQRLQWLKPPFQYGIVEPLASKWAGM